MGLLDEPNPVIAKQTCPKCKWGELIKKRGSVGKSDFYACTAYPKCTYKYSLENDYGEKVPTSTPRHKAGDKCRKCHRGTLVERSGKFGTFFGCSNYPNCKFTGPTVH